MSENGSNKHVKRLSEEHDEQDCGVAVKPVLKRNHTSSTSAHSLFPCVHHHYNTSNKRYFSNASLVDCKHPFISFDTVACNGPSEGRYVFQPDGLFFNAAPRISSLRNDPVTTQQPWFPV